MNVSKKAFTLVELLVVIATIALLMSILMPALAAGRAQGRAAVCKSNIRQLVLANIGYSNENDDFCVPAASDMWDVAGGYHRWHGVRDNKDEPFDPLRGPLVEYLADGKVKECPAKVRFVKGKKWGESFEKGCGGYGYNMPYLGSGLWQTGLDFKESYSQTTRMLKISKPDKTLMFTDCAMSLKKGSYIEYSFAEPPYFVMNGRVFTDMYASPSIHFRHRGKANIGWADGHIDSRQMAEFKGKNAYGVESADMKLGWFEPLDNSLFDLK
jgi:prepilin-type processing-associated H-X9-DG protein/prepilin-type N-terminal cleavage/methylation domain-containing protein